MTPFTRPSIVVGVDGSRTGVQAVLWAADEAVARDLPLRLVAVREPSGDTTGEDLREAADAVAAAGHAVEVLTHTHTGTAVSALVEESGSAVMVCVAAGLASSVGSLAVSAHCPVAVVRGRGTVGAGAGRVTVELDESPDSAAVLQFAVEEARLRSAPLRVVWAWRSKDETTTDVDSVGEGDHLVRIRLDQRLAEWKRRYPDLDVEPVVVHGTAVDYLARQADPPQLVVVGARNTASVDELLGPAARTTLRDTTVVIVDPQRLL